MNGLLTIATEGNVLVSFRCGCMWKPLCLWWTPLWNPSSRIALGSVEEYFHISKTNNRHFLDTRQKHERNQHGGSVHGM